MRPAAGGAVEIGGLQYRDVIVDAHGQRVMIARSRLSILANDKPGEPMSLKLDRQKTTITVHIQADEPPA